MKICCILNQKAGSAGDVQSQVGDLFVQKGVAVDILLSRPGLPITDLVNEALKRHCDVVVAGGGDGTVNAVASVLLDKADVRLGILPLGTLNHLAKDLNIPLTLPEAVNTICHGYDEPIDVAQVNDAYFLNNSSVGLYPAIVRLRESLQIKGRKKWWALMLSSFRILARFRRLHLELKLPDGTTVTRRTALLFVGNNAYETTAHKAGTRPSVQDGLLWVAVSTSTSRWGLFRTAVALMLGHDALADTLTLEASELTVSSQKEIIAVATDGEVLKLRPPLTYRMLPKALRVMVPEQLQAGE